MAARRSVVAVCCVGCSNLVALCYQIKDLFFTGNKLLLQPLYLNLLVLILQYSQTLVIIQQIVQFLPVNLIHGYCHSEVSLLRLPVIDAAFEKVSDGQILQCIHGKGFSRAGLPIREDGDSAGIEDQIEDRIHTLVV